MIKFNRSTKGFECLSNYYECPVTIDGVTYKSADAALKAQKRKYLKEGLDWEKQKVSIMCSILFVKFEQNRDLLDVLLGTRNELLVYTSHRHNNVWGVCYCNDCIAKVATNYLGLCLMYVRGILSGEDTVTIKDFDGNPVDINICSDWNDIMKFKQWQIALDDTYKSDSMKS